MFFAETVFLERPDWQRLLLPVAATLAGMLSVAYSLRFVHRVFFGAPAGDLPHQPHEPTRWMLLPSALLVAVCLLVGILPAQTVGPYLRTATDALLGANAPLYSLAVWHGLNLPLYMSLVALFGGIMLYLPCIGRRSERIPLLERIDGKNAFNGLLTVVNDYSARAVGWLTSPRLQAQMLMIVLVVIGGALLPFVDGPLRLGERLPAEIDPAFALLWAVGATCAVAAAWQAKLHRLAALILAGGAGLATSLTFVWFSAPDLALTQLAVEVVTAVLILLGLRWLPRRDKRFRAGQPESARSCLRRLRDLIIASAGGAGIAALTYAILTRPPVDGIAPFFVEQSLPQGGGLNVVNVILVDFRGFDTFGEITVVAIVALTVFALLRRFRPAPESVALPAQQLEQDHPESRPDPEAALPAGYLMLPAVLVRLLLPMAMLISLFFLLRGHNAPGGGFVGGLVFATAIILQYIVGGTLWVESRLRIHPLYWIAVGLLCAAAAGIVAGLAGEPFLASQAWHASLPLLGEIHLSTVLLFDLGVYLLVVGATVLMLVAIAHQSLRSQPRKTSTEGGH